jgi:hypothetical protein
VKTEDLDLTDYVKTDDLADYVKTKDLIDQDGNLDGNVIGNVTGDVTGNLIGDVTGDLTGGVTWNVIGNVTGELYPSTNGSICDINTYSIEYNVNADYSNFPSQYFNCNQNTIFAINKTSTNSAKPFYCADTIYGVSLNIINHAIITGEDNNSLIYQVYATNGEAKHVFKEETDTIMTMQHSNGVKLNTKLIIEEANIENQILIQSPNNFWYFSAPTYENEATAN